MDKEAMFNKVMDYAAETMTPVPPQTISKSLLSELTGVELTDRASVYDQEAELAKKAKPYMNMFGFDTFYDLFCFADDQDRIAKGGTKDLNKLSLTRRTVTRNGKTQTLNFYEGNDNKSKATDKLKSPSEPQVEAEQISANQLNVGFTGEVFGKPDAELINQVNRRPSSWELMGVARESCYDYLIYSGNRTYAIAGLLRSKGNLGIRFVSYDPQVLTDAVYVRVVLDVFKLAKDNGLGVDIKPFDKDLEDKLEPFMTNLTVKLTNGHYKLLAKQLPKVFGDAYVSF